MIQYETKSSARGLKRQSHRYFFSFTPFVISENKRKRRGNEERETSNVAENSAESKR